MTPGALLGRKYRLTRQIGVGGMGAVWAAVNQDTGREIALKLIRHSTDELRQRLRREARALGKLQHRNLIEIYDVGETGGGDPFLIMPLLHGETLSDLLSRERRLPEEVAARLARDVARALAAAHGGGVIHRDLKPANIFLHQEPDSDGPVVKVLDFGVSKNAEVMDGLLTVPGGLVGSPAYMSPEQARADRDIDPRSDLWSLGVILFEMLAGERPFKSTGPQLLPQIAFGEIPALQSVVADVDPALAELTSRCLERDRERRIGSAAELVTALQRFVGRSQIFNERRPSGTDPIPPLSGVGAPDLDRRGEPRAEEDELDESNALTRRLDDDIAALVRPRPLAARITATLPLAASAASAASTPRQGSSPALPAPSPPQIDAEQATVPFRLAAPMPWQPSTNQPGSGPLDGPTSTATEEEEEDPLLQGGTIKMTDAFHHASFGVGKTGTIKMLDRFGEQPLQPSSPARKSDTVKLPDRPWEGAPQPVFGAAHPATEASSTAPLLEIPSVDSQVDDTATVVAGLKVRSRIRVALGFGILVVVIVLLLIVFSTGFSSCGAPPKNSAATEATPPRAASSPPGETTEGLAATWLKR